MKIQKEFKKHVLKNNKILAYEGIALYGLLEAVWTWHLVGPKNARKSVQGLDEHLRWYVRTNPSYSNEQKKYFKNNLALLPIPAVFSIFRNNLSVRLDTEWDQVLSSIKHPIIRKMIKARAGDCNSITVHFAQIKKIPVEMTKLIDFLHKENIGFKSVRKIYIKQSSRTTYKFSDTEPKLSVNEQVFNNF